MPTHYWILLIVALSGCVTSPAPPLTEREHGYGQSEDEQTIIRRSAQLEAELHTKGLVLDDASLTAYITRVGQSLIPPAVTGAPPIRFHVLRSPLVNAFALPNGGIYINVGLLARLTNEAQLAHVLGHEIVHVIQRHSLQQHRSRKATIIAAHIADLALFGTSIAYLPALGALAGHSQSAELESDRLALDRMASAGYSLRGADELFRLMEEVNPRESIFGTVYSSHPDAKQRASDTRALLAQRQADVEGGRLNEREFQQFRERVVLENLRLKLNVHQYALVLQAVERDLIHMPQSPWLYYYRGEAYRLMAENPEGAAREEAWLKDNSFSKGRVEYYRGLKDENLKKAQQAYRQALYKDRLFFHAHRGLGLAAFAEDSFQVARQELNLYLQAGRDITDRGYIHNILGRIRP